MDRLRFVFAGCQHYEHGHFTAWRHIAAEPDLDFVFHYGDYIYEYRGRAPGQPGWGPLVRPHLGEEIIALPDYRQRYAQYRLDPDLRAAHAAHPFLVSYDDHEVDNNWAGGISEEDGSSRFPIAVPPEVFALRKAAAFQAWYEHMPVRRAALPRGPDITAYRRMDFGTMARVHVLDTRQFRDDQPCNDGVKAACPEVARPDAQMLGAGQEAWLLGGLTDSPARWNILAQQVPMMRRVLSGGGISMDKWDAYPAARQRLLDGMVERRTANPVVLSGDVHVALAATLRQRPEDPRSAAGRHRIHRDIDHQRRRRQPHDTSRRGDAAAQPGYRAVPRPARLLRERGDDGADDDGVRGAALRDARGGTAGDGGAVRGGGGRGRHPESLGRSGEGTPPNPLLFLAVGAYEPTFSVLVRPRRQARIDKGVILPVRGFSSLGTFSIVMVRRALAASTRMVCWLRVWAGSAQISTMVRSGPMPASASAAATFTFAGKPCAASKALPWKTRVGVVMARTSMAFCLR